MGKDSVIKNEKIFRVLIADAKEKDSAFPQSITPEMPLERILPLVSDELTTAPKMGFTFFFDKGPLEYRNEKINESQVVFGYSNIAFMSGGGMLDLYDILDNNKVKYNKELSSFMC